MPEPTSSSTRPQALNFAFLEIHSAPLHRLAAHAERYLHDDPNTTLIKLRQFAEVLVQQIAARVGLPASSESNLIDVIRRLRGNGTLPSDVVDALHSIRRAGNSAVHSLVGSAADALQQLKLARAVAVWFHQVVADDPWFAPAPFIVPRSNAADAEERLAQLEQALHATQEARTEAERTAQEALLAKLESEARAETLHRTQAEAERAAAEAEAQFTAERALLEAELTALRERLQGDADSTSTADKLKQRAATQELDLDEAQTRLLIDAQLRQAGWEADSVHLRHGRGARPEKGKNRAIAEWPTPQGPADYVLFVGLKPVAVVEAKRQSRNVPGDIAQAERYAEALEGVPFRFATNGRPYLHEDPSQSGLWFRDGRRETHHARPLHGWYSPEGLSRLLSHDAEAADQALALMPFTDEALRSYQQEAINSVEAGIARGLRNLLVAMATGTGKTRTCIGLVYRLLKAKRFRRVLFLVDRESLGLQATEAFQEAKVEGLHAFADLYDVKGLRDLEPASETRLHVSTVQGMVKRILYAGPDGPPPVDTYDCIIVDECHRGYVLDRERTESEREFRDERDYISTYRRVLDHFDAVRIGLTATPALHTTQIFGKPVYQYTYRQAVIDGMLIDHEPPYRIVTALAENGIHLPKDQPITTLDTRTGEVSEEVLPDEVSFEIEAFNRLVLNENFNRVVCETLTQVIDFEAKGKTLVFCATDAHADQVVGMLKDAFARAGKTVPNNAIVKITGASDDPNRLIHRFKNERDPRIAVTVDLLTTGVDIPSITNLVFLRRVKSRILFEQMLGRATRLCPAIGKEVFRIFDAVDLYAALEPVTSMVPVVVNPSIPFTQLVSELDKVSEPAAKRTIVEQFIAKLRRKLPKIKDAKAFEIVAGMAPAAIGPHLASLSPDDAAAWLLDHADLASFLDRTTGEGPKVVVSDAEDELLRVEQGYGEATKPGDYLEDFGAFLDANFNKLTALLVVKQRPRDLTRRQLKELELELAKAGYTEARLRAAYKGASNADIAATIVGFIRQRALGSPLIPYAERVERGLARMLTSRDWTDGQKRWLERIGKQLVKEVVVDQEALDSGVFKANGGFARIDKEFGGRLMEVLADLQDQIWKDVG